MLAWLMNMGFAGGGTPSSGSGPYEIRLVNVNKMGKR